MDYHCPSRGVVVSPVHPPDCHVKMRKVGLSVVISRSPLSLDSEDGSLLFLVEGVGVHSNL